MLICLHPINVVHPRHDGKLSPPGLGIRQPKGVILYGPPGTGKTLIVKALAAEIGASIYQISGPEVFSKYYGEAERKLREIFDEAKQNAPSLIAIDELDALTPSRAHTQGDVEARVVATLLTLMDGMHTTSDLIVIGTTNRLESIDNNPGIQTTEKKLAMVSERLERQKVTIGHQFDQAWAEEQQEGQ